MSRVLRVALTGAFVIGALVGPSVARAATTVCVDVQVKSWTLDPEGHSAALEESQPALPPDPFAIDPARYLGRMVRYQVTHEVGFEAVETDCEERLTVELYPLRAGWTVFARYSGHSREEKVDEVGLDEFTALAQRLARALLRDMPVSDTITRDSVLEADSESDLRTIDGDGHFVMALGTQVRAGELPTADGGPVADELRLLTPLSFQLGYRGKYQAWGLDAFVRGALGTSKQAPKRNPTGGHVDYEAGGAFGLHFLRYLDAQGMNSFYFGGGAQFQLSVFSVIRPEGDRDSGDNEYLVGGGLDVDLLIGYEFMRASSVHFFVQGELHAPTYKFQTDVDSGGIDSYVPGGLLQIGMVFLMRAAWLTLAGVGWLALGASAARAQSTTRTCVEVVTRQSDAEELRRLVMDELDRHKTHRAAEGDCESHLRVEIIALDVGRYVTARMNTEVPHRERVEGDDLEAAISRALRVVLHNDPVRLRGPRQEDVFRASVRALRDGQFLYGAEAFQVVGVVDGEVSSAPGLAFVVRREVLAWHLAARLSFAHRLDGNPEQLALTGHAGLQLQVSWFPWYSGDTSAYVGGLLGVDHVRFEGPAPLHGPQDTATFSKTGFGLGLRTGVEFFRTTTGRLDVFAQAVLPAYAATDEEGGVVDSWVPTVTVGAGMLF